MIKTFMIYSIIDMCLDKLSDIIESKICMPMIHTMEMGSSKSSISDYYVGRKFNWLTVDISRDYDPSTNEEIITRWIFCNGVVHNVVYNGVFHVIHITFSKKYRVTLKNAEKASSHSSEIVGEYGHVGLSLDAISSIHWENSLTN